MAKATHPFKKAATLGEFFKLLRADLERLRGKKFRRWVVSDVMTSSHRIEFDIEADLTRLPDSFGFKGSGKSWFDIAEARNLYSTVLWLRKPYGIFMGGRSHSDGKTYSPPTSKHRVEIATFMLPKIQKICLDNEALGERKAEMVKDNKELFHLRAAQENANLATQNHREKIEANFDRENPRTDPVTGKKIRTK